VSSGDLARELAAVAEGLELMNGEGRSAVVWALAGSDGHAPEVLHAGRHARKELIEQASKRLASGEASFEVEGPPGVRGKVVVCGTGGDRAAYGLFLHGEGTPHLGATTEGLIEAAERSLGKRVADMTRLERQEVVRFLDERGVFMLRKAVETVADRLGVTRFTIYNYLGASADPEDQANQSRT
jgi:hypothetical protein